jgi:UDP-glucuronate decarboxylase
MSAPRSAPPRQQKRILVTGGAGFVGSNLVDVLMMQVRGAEGGVRDECPVSLSVPLIPVTRARLLLLLLQGHIVYVLDNLFTGKRKNIEHWIGAESVWSSGPLSASVVTLPAGPQWPSSCYPPRAAGHPNFTFFQHDVIHPFFIEVNEIYHLACPASPPHYQYNPIKARAVCPRPGSGTIGDWARCRVAY